MTQNDQIHSGSAKVWVRVQKTSDGREKKLHTNITVGEATAATAKLSTVNQTASNAVELTFSADASKAATKDNIKIKSKDGATEYTINTLTFAADGKSATAKVFGTFTNGTEYNVAYGDDTVAFTAKVGAVASVVVGPSTAEQNVTTPISITLKDADGIDVTPSNNLDTTCLLSISGNYSTAEIGTPSAAKLTMANVGDKATLTVTYNGGASTSQDISTSTEITCVAAQPVKGTGVYALADTDLSINSQSVKFYQSSVGSTDGTLDLPVDDTNYVYFYAKDANGDAISYDSYDVASSNTNILNASIFSTAALGTDSGKFTIVQVDPSSVGTGQLTITATKNNAVTTYKIPFSTYEAGLASSMTLTIEKNSTLSNANDDEYFAVVKAQLKDKNNRDVAGSYIAEITTKNDDNNAIAGDDIGQLKVGGAPLGGNASSASNTTGSFNVTAWGADAKTYTIKVTGADNKNTSGLTFSKSVSITVRALPDKLTNISYQIELTSSVDDDNIVDPAKYETITTKLYATANGLFAGYVDMTKLGGAAFALGDKTFAAGKIDAAYVINGLQTGVYFGNSPHDGAPGTGVLYGTPAAPAAGTTGLAAATGATNAKRVVYQSVDRTGAFYDSTVAASATNPRLSASTNTNIVASNIDMLPDGNGDVAKDGTYSVRYYAQIGDPAKMPNVAWTTKTNTFTVKNSYEIPTVKVASSKVDTPTNNQSIISDVLSTNVELNYNTDVYSAIVELTDNNYNQAVATTTSTGNNRLVVRYAVVQDTLYDGATPRVWNFYVPMSTTFTQK